MGAVRAADLDMESGVVVLNLWASWCEPCLSEMPSMLAAARALKDKGVRFVFVSYDEGWDPQRRVLAQVAGQPPPGVTFLRDPKAKAGGAQQSDSLWVELGATGVPETFFLRDGRVMEKFVGPVDWNHPDVRLYLSLLGRL